MTRDEEALLAAVVESPEDDLPRMALADLWEELGLAGRAACARRLAGKGPAWLPGEGKDKDEWGWFGRKEALCTDKDDIPHEVWARLRLDPWHPWGSSYKGAGTEEEAWAALAEAFVSWARDEDASRAA